MLCLLLLFLQGLGGSKENKVPVAYYNAASDFVSSHKTVITDVQWLPETFEVQRV